MQICKYANADEMFHAVYKECRTKVSFFANNILDDREEASDISLDAFIKLWILRDSFSSANKMKSFVFTCTQNACLNRLKYVKLRKAKNYEILQHYYLSATNEIPEIFTESREAELIRAVKSLDKKYLECIWLFYFEKMTCVRIANKLNLSERNVRFFLAKGREVLKSSLSSN